MNPASRSGRRQKRKPRLIVFALAATLTASLLVAPVRIAAQSAGAAPETFGPRWVDQFGTRNTDRVLSLSAADGAVYAAGLIGAHRDNVDGFVRKYNPQGRVVWQQRFGQDAFTTAESISAAASGSYVGGNFWEGRPEDSYIRHYDPEGSLVWEDELVPPTFDDEITTTDVASTDDAVYIVGSTTAAFAGETHTGPGSGEDAYVRKYDLQGNVIWTRQFGTPETQVLREGAYGVAAVAGDVYVTGNLAGTIPGETSSGGEDAFIRKYDSAGQEVWTRQFGTEASDRASALSEGADGIYVGGGTGGTFPSQTKHGKFDAFVRKYDFDGSVSWTRQVGPIEVGGGHYPSVSSTAHAVYLAATAQRHRAVPGETSSGRADPFIRKYNSAGQEVWTHQFGTPEFDFASAVSATDEGVYVGGDTQGAFPGQTREPDLDYDAYVVRLVRGRRSVGLGPKKLRRRGIGQGIVRADDDECSSGVRVLIRRRPLWKRRWRTIRRPSTNSDGFYRTANPIRRRDGQPRPGRYRAVVPRFTFTADDGSEVTCERARSRVRWVPRS